MFSCLQLWLKKKMIYVKVDNYVFFFFKKKKEFSLCIPINLKLHLKKYNYIPLKFTDPLFLRLSQNLWNMLH